MNDVSDEGSEVSHADEIGEPMIELTNHKAYELLEHKYERVDLDYVILQSDEEYDGLITHKKAILAFSEILNKRFADMDYHIEVEENKMSAVRSSIEELLAVPEVNPYGGEIDRSYSIPNPIPYWFAFLEPPYKTPYSIADFRSFNDSLFPVKERIDVYRWNDNFSNYFDAGKEWWGTGLWSVYDTVSKVFVIIGASLTD